MKPLRPDLFAVRGWIGWVHLLAEGNDLVLIDSGFIGDFLRIRRAVAALGRKPSDLKAILLTHGHLDHTANASRLQEWSGARVIAPAGDELHVQGTYPYRGISRACGWLEAGGRRLLRYRPPHVGRWVKDGDELPFWGGLRVVGLPGHTAGHVGFHSVKKRVLFAGDAVAMSWRIALPPSFLNTDTPRMRQSVQKLARFEIDLLVPAHYFRLGDKVIPRVREKAAQMD